MSNEPPVQVRQFGELVAAVPVLLGFHPARSLVVILTKRGRVALTTRTDLPDVTESAQNFADSVATRIAHAAVRPAGAAGAAGAGGADGVDGAVLIVVSPHRRRSDEDVVSRMAHALARVGIAAGLMVWAEGTRAGQRWSCYDGCAHGVVPEATTLQVAFAVHGRAVLSSREAVAASIAPVADQPTMRTRAAMVTRALADPAAQRFDALVMTDALREWQTGRLVLDDERVALLALALTDKQVRDDVVSWTIQDWADDAHTLWIELVRQTPAPFVAEPAALLALTAMIKGDSVLTDAALGVAEAADPGHTLTALLRMLHAQGIPPSLLHSALTQTLGSGPAREPRPEDGPAAGMP